jgi:CRISPR/Cas system CMR subunit Cmr4 (Cas7 group RAMP superfamily)
LVHDEIFKKLLPLVVPVFPRIHIDPIRGTVVEGALWNTEFIPSESLFYGTVITQQKKTNGKGTVDQFIKTVGASWFQVGGCKGIGMGIVTPIWR